MAKGKAEENEKSEKSSAICKSVFKSGLLTKEDYTRIWIELISTSERKKCVSFSASQ